MELERWYAAYTLPRHEKKVVENLRLRNVESLLPLYSAPRRWKNGLKVNLELPLFPGYVFVKADHKKQITVLNTPSVQWLVGSGRHPIPVQNHEIEILRNGIQDCNPEPHPFIKIGDRVQMISGPLTGLEGILVQKKDGYRFVLSMNLIMQSISVEVDAADVERHSSSSSTMARPISAWHQSA